ncbi:oligosaccharide repeat unit polymerase [Bacillus sp. OV166]|uniref:O-antigen polymerase n=1 Tax=Bacillus sp. OV166 TaxID=1882763 RepID=UPI000A2ACF38|nr:O-antigen polymerase [Bacillus sp. OV166]SMQ85072.1 oligosaccharide repeat unit polymerase [Bacillus sp. OV166]
MVLVFIVFILMFSFFNYLHFGKFVNYLNLFLGLWCTVSVLSMFGFYGLYIPPLKTYVYILIVLTLFEVSSIIFFRLKQGIRVEQANIILRWKRLNSISMICLIILVPFAIKGFGVVITEGFYRLRISGFSEILYNTNEKLLLMNIVQPMVLAISLLSLIELIENKKIRLSLIISVFNCILYILIFGGRWVLLEFMLLAGIVLYDKFGGNFIRLIKNNKLITIVIAIIAIIILVITQQRSVAGGKGFLYNIYIYFVGSIHLFGVYMNNPKQYLITSDHLLYGKEFFGGFLEPIFLFLKFMGMNIHSGIETINIISQQFVNVSPDAIMNNNSTMIYAFLRDFGILGLFICPFVLAIFYMHVYKRKLKSPNIYNRSVYYYSVSILPFLLFEWMPARMSIIVVLFFLYVLTRKPFQVRVKKKI